MIEFYGSHKLLVWSTAILLSIASCLLYYINFGPHPISSDENSPDILVRRFRPREWISHWLMLLGFLILAITGLIQVIPSIKMGHLGPFHGWLGFIFFIISLITLVGWIPDALFKRYDWSWLLKMGGYFSHNTEPIVAGRFNAGQKIYYWSILLVLIGLLVTAIVMEHGSHSSAGRKELFWCLHRLLGCLATMMVIVHGFLALFVNPDTSRVLRDGRISKAYIDKHHPLWKIPQ